MIRAFLIASSPVARVDWKSRLKAHSVMIAGEAASVESAGTQLSDARVDVLLVDAGDEKTVDIVESLAESELAADFPTVLLAVEPNRSEFASALRAGVRGVLSREAPSEQIAAALQAAAKGLLAILPRDVELLSEVETGPPAETGELAEPLAEPLTPREREVLQMLAAGLANKEIAGRLNISDHTAKFHVAAILSKLGAATRTEAVTIGIRRGLVLL